MRIRPRKIIKKIEKMVLPGVRHGDKNVDWREVAEQLLNQNQELTKEIERLQETTHWFSSIFPPSPPIAIPVVLDENVPAGHVYIMSSKVEV